MALKQVRTAKAVADIDEVHFLKHVNGEPEITQALIDNTGSDDWFSVATLKGSVEINQEELSIEKINIDQSNMPIGVTTEPGDFNVSFQMPSFALANLKRWLEISDEASDKELNYTTDQTEVKRYGYGARFNAALTNMVMVVTSKTGETFIFPNIQGQVVLGREDKVWVLRYSGMVLAASNEKNDDFYILAEAESRS